jgi:hypothetical protein
MELLQEAYKFDNNNIKTFNINNHFTFVEDSKIYKNENLSTNLTSNPNFGIFDSDNQKKIVKLDAKYNPNLIGQNKDNYLTPAHHIDKKTSLIKELPNNVLEKAGKFKSNAQAHLINSKDKKLLESRDGKLYENYNAPTVEEYSKEMKLSSYEKINFINKFEKINEEYLNTSQGKQEYEIFKKFSQGSIQKNDVDNS